MLFVALVTLTALDERIFADEGLYLFVGGAAKILFRRLAALRQVLRHCELLLCLQ